MPVDENGSACVMRRASLGSPLARHRGAKNMIILRRSARGYGSSWAVWSGLAIARAGYFVPMSGRVSARTRDVRVREDQREADRDQDHGAEVDQLEPPVRRKLAGVDEQREHADQDQHRGPEEAAVAVGADQGLPRRMTSQMPRAIRTSGQKMSARSQSSHPRLWSRKYTPTTMRTAGQKRSFRQNCLTSASLVCC